MSYEIIKDLLIATARSSEISIVGNTIYFWASQDVYFTIDADQLEDNGNSLVKIYHRALSLQDSIAVDQRFKQKLISDVNF